MESEGRGSAHSGQPHSLSYSRSHFRYDVTLSSQATAAPLFYGLLIMAFLIFVFFTLRMWSQV